MNIRLGVAALAVAGAAIITSAAPALASGPPVPPGCSFDKGVLTCVTTTTTTTTAGPFSTNGEVPITTTFGEVVTGTQLCPSGADGVQLNDVYFNETVTTTTTTERHGLNGKVFNTSTATTPSFNSVSNADNVICFASAHT
jgi:hypothetical protein